LVVILFGQRLDGGQISVNIRNDHDLHKAPTLCAQDNPEGLVCVNSEFGRGSLTGRRRPDEYLVRSHHLSIEQQGWNQRFWRTPSPLHLANIGRCRRKDISSDTFSAILLCSRNDGHLPTSPRLTDIGTDGHALVDDHGVRQECLQTDDPF
jgi:hypothetical protein